MRASWLLLVLAAAGCHRGLPPPATLDRGHDTCASCRMVVSDAHTAAQIVADGEDPLFFDDIGCLVTYLGDHPAPHAGAIVYVADHRTAQWVPAATAVFTRGGTAMTPMGGGIIAHTNAASRDQDPSARGGTSVSGREILGALADGAAR